MEGPELELFYEMFHTYDPPSDSSKKFIFKPDYNIWSDYISKHNLYVGELDYKKVVNPHISYVEETKLSKFLYSTDYNFLKTYLDSKSQFRADKIITNVLDIVKNEIFSPPNVDYIYGGKMSIHPGKCLSSASILLKQNIPVVLSLRKEKDSLPVYFKVKKQINNLIDLKQVYKKNIHGNFAITKSNINRLQIWSEGHWPKGSDGNGWIKYPQLDVDNFFKLLSNELNILEGEKIFFTHHKTKKEYILTIPNNPKEDISKILKKITCKLMK